MSGDNGYEGGESYALIEKPYLSFEPTECEVVSFVKPPHYFHFDAYL